MKQKPKHVYGVILLWIIIALLFLGLITTRTMDFFDYYDSFSEFGSMEGSISNLMTFSYITYIILFIVIVVLSFLMAYSAIFSKGRLWLPSVIVASFLGFFMFQALYILGMSLIRNNVGEIFENFESVTYILLLIFVPVLLFLLTRPVVESYYLNN